MFPFFNPLKTLENTGFTFFFREYEMGALVKNELR